MDIARMIDAIFEEEDITSVGFGRRNHHFISFFVDLNEISPNELWRFGYGPAERDAIVNGQPIENNGGNHPDGLEENDD